MTSKKTSRATITVVMPKSDIDSIDALADVINHDDRHKLRPEGGKKAKRSYLVRLAITTWMKEIVKRTAK